MDGRERMSTTDAVRDEILGEIAAMIRDVLGEEWVQETPIERETTFGAELEFESIELVALGEQIQARWPAVDFVTWLSSMQLDEIIEMRVGQLVDYVAECR